MMDWTDRLAAYADDPAQVENVRPVLEEYARTTRRALRLVEALLGVNDHRPEFASEHGKLIEDHQEALARVEALQHALETARTWIAVLQGKIAEFEDEASDSYAVVGLRSTVHDVVVAAARRALLSHYHPDKAPAEDKVRMGAMFASASAAFDRIAADRRC